MYIYIMSINDINIIKIQTYFCSIKKKIYVIYFYNERVENIYESMNFLKK
jgi:hypothetical protein